MFSVTVSTVTMQQAQEHRFVGILNYIYIKKLEAKQNIYYNNNKRKQNKSKKRK